MESGGVAYRSGNLTFRAGRLPHYDYVDSPYSLFINGDGLTADLMEAIYDDGRFLYSTRWIGLNHNSDAVTTVMHPDVHMTNTGFPERGANLHTFAAALRGHDLRHTGRHRLRGPVLRFRVLHLPHPRLHHPGRPPPGRHGPGPRRGRRTTSSASSGPGTGRTAGRSTPSGSWTTGTSTG